MIRPDSEYYIVNHYSKLTWKDYELLINEEGNKRYYLNGNWHRENAPAIMWLNGYQVWYIHNKLHNLNGPARIEPSGNKEYFIDNKEYEENKYWEIIFTTKEYIKKLVKFCPICEEYFESREEVAIHIDQEIENNKFTSDLQNDEIIQKRLELIIK